MKESTVSEKTKKHLNTVNVIVRNENGELCLDCWEGNGPPLMECGHVAQGSGTIPGFEEGDPSIPIRVCVICAGISKGYNVLADDQNPYAGRVAKCDMCKNESPSSNKLAFFEYKEKKESDTYYCGCRGWD